MRRATLAHCRGTARGGTCCRRARALASRLGKRAFIGANTVVTRAIPPYTVAAGVPARVIDYFGPPGSEPAELSSSNSDRSG